MRALTYLHAYPRVYNADSDSISHAYWSSGNTESTSRLLDDTVKELSPGRVMFFLEKHDRESSPLGLFGVRTKLDTKWINTELENKCKDFANSVLVKKELD